MLRIKPFVVFGLVLLLGAIAVLGVLATRPQANVTAGDSDMDLEVPAAGMTLNKEFKAQPATGAAAVASVPFSNVKVNTDGTQEAQNEPYVAVDPANPRHLVVGANSWSVGNGRFQVFAYVSFDGGQTWAGSQPYISIDPSRVNAADPTIAFGADGTVYFGFVALSPGQGAVAVSSSTDGGLTWTRQSWATSLSGAADKPAIAVAKGVVQVYYQNGSLMSTSSADGAQTWAAPTTIAAGGRNAAPVVDAAGNVYVFYNTSTEIKMFAKGAGDRADRNVTVEKAVALQARPTQYRASIYPTAGVDAAGKLYVAWADGRNSGRGNDIMFSSSVDGNTWSSAVAVNTDGTSADQLMPALAVGRDGAVTVAWLDNRNDSANVNYDVYMARYANGAFGANQRVTAVSSNPNNDPRLGGSLIGDYFAVAVGDGYVYPAWTDTRNNNQDIYMALVPTNTRK